MNVVAAMVARNIMVRARGIGCLSEAGFRIRLRIAKR